MIPRFRAWDKNRQRMDSEDVIFHTWEVADLYNPHFVVMQSTGLYDKHGKEIFEDDWFKSYSRANPFTIIWYNGSFRGKYPESEGEGFHFDDYEANTGEVIGNIYEGIGGKNAS